MIAWIIGLAVRLKPRNTVLIGALIGALATGICIANAQEVGIARDELVYMKNGSRYADWWIGLATFQHGAGKDSITRTFGGPGATDNNREHPPLMKTLMGLSHRLFHRVLGVSELTAFRLPSAVLEGVLAVLVFAMVLELWGLAEAILAALLVVFLPRAVFHASLAAFDAPIACLWFATIYAYWRNMDGRRWPWQAGVVFGLALATKHTAVLLPFALGLHFLIVGHRVAGWRRLLTHRWRVIASLAVLGPATLIAVWPWLWLGPEAHIRDWLAFHLHHVHYNFEYLGVNWNAPRFPWHVAVVTTLFTVPVVTLGAAAIGGARWIVRWRDNPDPDRGPVLLLALSAAASMGPFLLGTTPIFGAEKHWMPALPTICVAAGVGGVWAARELAELVRERWRTHAVVAVGSLIVLAAATETLVAQPYALTWYNALAGEAPGGADLGMNRQFWGVAARGVLPVIAAHAPSEGTAPVYSHDASPAWSFYQAFGLVPDSMPDAGMEVAGIANSKLAIVIHEKHFNRHDYLIWKSYGTVRPIYVLRSRGVPIVSVYERTGQK